MAGGLLARQLSVEQPDLRIIVVDQKTDFDRWVGESTVEVFDDYAVRTCRLGPHLATHHIVKHGLRFWFDSPEKDLRMCELSEQGRSRYTTLNRGVQLDRALRRNYGFTNEELEHLIHHIAADKTHGEVGMRLILGHAKTSEQQEEAYEGARRGTRAWWAVHEVFARGCSPIRPGRITEDSPGSSAPRWPVRPARSP
jgi:hypothetical protein